MDAKTTTVTQRVDEETLDLLLHVADKNVQTIVGHSLAHELVYDLRDARKAVATARAEGFATGVEASAKRVREGARLGLDVFGHCVLADDILALAPKAEATANEPSSEIPNLYGGALDLDELERLRQDKLIPTGRWSADGAFLQADEKPFALIAGAAYFAALHNAAPELIRLARESLNPPFTRRTLKERAEKAERERDEFKKRAHVYHLEADSASDIHALREALEKAERERDAYRKAKQENDERFTIERDQARAERDELTEAQSRYMAVAGAARALYNAVYGDKDGRTAFRFGELDVLSDALRDALAKLDAK